MREEKNIEVWHVDEFRGKDAKFLRTRLMSTTLQQLQKMSIILFMSPHALLPDSEWMPVLCHISKVSYCIVIPAYVSHGFARAHDVPSFLVDIPPPTHVAQKLGCYS